MPSLPRWPAARDPAKRVAPLPASPRPVTLWHWLRAALLAWWVALAVPGTGAEPLELAQLEVLNTDQGLLIDFDTRFELPNGVEDALQKGVALHFVAEAQVLQERWYWRDRRVAQAARTWRVAYQPLTFSYRVNFGGLGQTYPTLAEALRTVQRSTGWRIAEPLPANDDGKYRVEFSYRLDRDQLPRPLQIGVGNSPEWNLQVERSVPVRLR